MNVVTSRAALRTARAEFRGQCVGLVATMGNLHAGHLALVQAARRDCERVIATIFVNPAQFGPDEDLDAYPRTPEEDLAALRDAQTDLVFMPSVDEMFGAGDAPRALVQVPGLSSELCGASRPGHFDGVTTIVTRLFGLTEPHNAYFGEKDYQQLTIIRRMAEELDLPVTVHGVPTTREADGLAMSSRNGYLTAEERTRAPALQAALQSAGQQIRQGRRDWAAVAVEVRSHLKEAGMRCDYVEIRDGDNLGTLELSSTPRSVVVLAAAWLGKPRLIDNLRIELA